MAITITLWSAVCLVATLLVIYVSVRFVGRLLRRRKYRLPPGPTGLPILGNFHLQTHLSLWDHRDKYGDVSYIKLFGKDIIVFNSVEVIREAFQNADTADVFSDRPPTFFGEYVNSDDVVFKSPSVENWKPLRQISHTLLKQYGDGIEALEKVVCDELDYVIENLHEHLTHEIDMKSYFESSLINVLCILFIGERFAPNHWKVKIALEMVRRATQLSTPFLDIFLQVFPVFRLIPFGPGSIYKRTIQFQQKLLGFLYHDLKTLPADVIDSRKGIVYDLLKISRDTPWMTESKITGLIQDMFGAGFITTERSLRACFLILLHYPIVQIKIQKEIDEVIGNDRKPNLSDRITMPYTVAAILELVRFSSIGPLGIPHACARDIDFHGYTIPRGSIIIPNLFRVHHDESLWDNPWTFTPERFLDEHGDLLPASHPNRRNNLAFGLGKRRCMGENFAKSRIFIYITHLLQSFTFKPTKNLPSCDPLHFEADLVLCPPEFKVRIESRNSR